MCDRSAPARCRTALQGVQPGRGAGSARLSARISLVAIILLSACAPLKEIELRPQLVRTGVSGFGVSEGVCFSTGSAPPLSFHAGPGEAMVGFDDYYDPGTNPFPCSTSRMATYRSVVVFDLSQFDQVVSGDLMFNLASSATRENGATIRSTPGINSVATALGPGMESPFNNALPYDYGGDLGPGRTQKASVDTALSDWTTHVRPNFGFVLDLERGPVTRNAHPTDNDLQLSWYDNFRLHILYNPKLNPRAPQ